MGMFRRNQQRQVMTHRLTRGFNIGAPEAEAEGAHIKDFFEDYLNVINEINLGKFIVTGRKGTGKTAVARYIANNGDDDTKCIIIDSADVKFQNILQALPDIDCAVYFEWLILVNITKMIINCDGRGEYARYMSDLKKFYDRNTGVVNISANKISEIEKHTEVNFDVLRNSFPSTIAKFYKNRKEIKGYFYEFIPALREIIQIVLGYQIFADVDFFVCFDDLDVKFKIDRDSPQLLDLIRVAKRYNTGYLSKTHCSVLIFMRDDIQRHLKGADADVTKIFGSYESKIKWYNHTDGLNDENKINIKRFINKRIEYNFIKNGLIYDETDPWNTLFASFDKGKSSFKYVLDHTFYRPRDIINFLKDIGSMDIEYPISLTETNKLLNNYSDECIGELRDELAMLFDQNTIGNIFKMLSKWAKTDFGHTPTYREVVDLFAEFNIHIDILELLREYDIIIPRDPKSNELFCNYRENQIDLDISQYSLTLHKSVYLFYNKYRTY